MKTKCVKCNAPADTYVDRDELGILVYQGSQLVAKLERALKNAKADAKRNCNA